MPDGAGGTPRAAARERAAAGLTAAGFVVAALALTGCGARTAAAPAQPIKIVSAYVMQSDGIRDVDAYFVLSNAGPADRLVSASSSAGGQVVMLDPSAPGPTAARAVTALTFPGHSVTKLDPTGMYLEILNPGPLHVGTDITLTLHFAHDGPLKVLAQVNNPQTGGSGYFGS